jgi:hypothetical protein
MVYDFHQESPDEPDSKGESGFEPAGAPESLETIHPATVGPSSDSTSAAVATVPVEPPLLASVGALTDENGDGNRNGKFLDLGPVPVPPRPSREAEPRVQESMEGPIGVDIGTANIGVAFSRDRSVLASLQRNAFYAIPWTPLTREALLKDKIMFFEKDHKLYILGHSAEDFANICHDVTRRPVENGMLNAREIESEAILKAMISHLVKTPKKKGEIVCFSIPGDPLDRPDSSIVYHESIIKEHLSGLGYRPISVNEGMAVVLSELAGNNFTGIGVSLGGGLCNVCFSYLTVPVVSFSLMKGGDYIDSMVARSTGEPVYEVRQIKEHDLDLSVSPRNKIETALHVYYDDLLGSLARSFQRVFGSSDNIPRLPKPVPVVLAGGTILPPGSLQRFQRHMRQVRLPFRISEIARASMPLYATVKGALMMARLNP